MDLNIAFLDNPFLEFTQIEGVYKCRSSFIDTYLDYYRASGFNISVRTAKYVGKLQKDGTYDGLMGLVERNISDILFMPVPLITTPKEPTLFGPVIEDVTNVIHSFTPPVHFEVVDIINSLKAFDFHCFLFIFFSFLVCVLFLKLFFRGFNIFHFISMVFGQWFQTIESNKFLFVVIIIFIDYIDSLINVNFSTELVACVPPKYLSTLDDIIETNAKPYFMKGSYFYDYVMMSNEDEYVSIKSMLNKNKDEVLIEISDLRKFMEVVGTGMTGTMALISPVKYTRMIIKMGCMMGKSIMEKCIADQRNYYQSKPLASELLAFPMSKNSSELMRRKLIFTWYAMTEFRTFHVVLKGAEDLADIAEYPYECISYFSSVRKAENDYVAIPLQPYKTTIRILFVVYSLALIILVIEHLFKSSRIAALNNNVTPINNSL